MNKFIACAVSLLLCCSLYGDNQTPTVSPVLPPTDLPFSISIRQMNLTLPNGWHSGAVAMYEGKVLLMAGRTNGMHGFDNTNVINNFPPSAQNTTVYVIDFDHEQIWSRSLTDPSSGLSQTQIDLLSVTSPEAYQPLGTRTMYMCGGYGVDSSTNLMGTKPYLTAVDVPGLMSWVMQNDSAGTAASYIRQTMHPLVKVTGGYMDQADPLLPTLLILGQDFTGYYTPGSNGAYTDQVRSFRIADDGVNLEVIPSEFQPTPNPAFRRRDLPVSPIMMPQRGQPKKGYVAFSGVFTESDGYWTVPIVINDHGYATMADPEDPYTFKQAMNNYACPTVPLFSQRTGDMYVVFLGGITYGFFTNGVFTTDDELPFTNEVTTIKIDPDMNFTQYIMDAEYPSMYSYAFTPPRQLLFGAGAFFFPSRNVNLYRNEVIKLDKISKRRSTVLGYVVGGIQSSLPNTNTRLDSSASPYIFQISLNPE